jgi:hypothetical protein
MTNIAPGKRRAAQPVSGNFNRPRNIGKRIDTTEAKMSQGNNR